jgi:ubiquinone/menaquinone biosynthesis C-methylase UbiE
VPVIRQTIREVARVLRPGGLFVIYEFVVYNLDDPSPVGEYLLDLIARENGEPFAWDFCHLDFLAELRQGGFRDAQRIQTSAGRPAVVATP